MVPPLSTNGASHSLVYLLWKARYCAPFSMVMGQGCRLAAADTACCSYSIRSGGPAVAGMLLMAVVTSLAVYGPAPLNISVGLSR